MWIKHSKTLGCLSHQRETESNYMRYIYVCIQMHICMLSYRYSGEIKLNQI